jgi:hypothetical protein
VEMFVILNNSSFFGNFLNSKIYKKALYFFFFFRKFSLDY